MVKEFKLNVQLGVSNKRKKKECLMLEIKIYMVVPMPEIRVSLMSDYLNFNLTCFTLKILFCLIS